MNKMYPFQASSKCFKYLREFLYTGVIEGLLLCLLELLNSFPFQYNRTLQYNGEPTNVHLDAPKC